MSMKTYWQEVIDLTDVLFHIQPQDWHSALFTLDGPVLAFFLDVHLHCLARDERSTGRRISAFDLKARAVLRLVGRTVAGWQDESSQDTRLNTRKLPTESQVGRLCWRRSSLPRIGSRQSRQEIVR